MKINKNFNEIRRKVWKTIEKVLQKLKEKLISFYWNFEKKFVIFEKILCKFSGSARFFKNFGYIWYKIAHVLYETY